MEIDSSIELIDTSNYSVSKFYDEETLQEDANGNPEDKNDEDYEDQSTKPSPAKKLKSSRKTERRKKVKSTKTDSQNDDLVKIALGCDICHPEGKSKIPSYSHDLRSICINQYRLQMHEFILTLKRL